LRNTSGATMPAFATPHAVFAISRGLKSAPSRDCRRELTCSRRVEG